jgi:zinc D-Ala-D-Ala carboxypeptidase
MRATLPPMRFLRVVAAAVLVAAGLTTLPLAAPSPVAGVGPLPPCELNDVLTAPRGYDDWATTLVDWNLSVGPDYKPPDLVLVSSIGLAGEGYVRKVAVADLEAMAAAARKNGTPLRSISAYRSYKQQTSLFNGYAGWNSKTKTYSNYDSAVKYSHRPGHSEHQLGLTIDFAAASETRITRTWEKTRTGAWMAKHAWEYGWLMSYPNVPFDTICFNYEPWHYRYVGRDLARKIHDSGLTIREYLWANFTQLDTTLQPVATATAAPTPTPSAGPSGAASNAPTATRSEPPAAANPPATAAPASTTGSLFGADPAVVIVGALLVLALVALAFSVRRARGARRPG